MSLTADDLKKLLIVFGDGSSHAKQGGVIVELRRKYAGDDEAMEKISEYDAARPGERNDAMKLAQDLDAQKHRQFELEVEKRDKIFDERVARVKARKEKEGV